MLEEITTVPLNSLCTGCVFQVLLATGVDKKGDIRSIGKRHAKFLTVATFFYAHRTINLFGILCTMIIKKSTIMPFFPLLYCCQDQPFSHLPDA